jgi:hypothetical protein
MIRKTDERPTPRVSYLDLFYALLDPHPQRVEETPSDSGDSVWGLNRCIHQYPEGSSSSPNQSTA